MNSKPTTNVPTISDQQNGATGGMVPSAPARSASKLAASFDELAKLGDGWDSYGAPAPNLVAIVNAKKFVSKSEESGLAIERIEPSAMGGLGVTISVGDREAVVEFYNQGTAHALFSDDKSGEMRTVAVATNAVAYQEVITEIRKYLHGK